MNKRNFGDEVLYISLLSNRSIYDLDLGLTAVFYKGIIKGTLEMDNGSIYYLINGQRFDIKANKPILRCSMHELERVQADYCFDNGKDLIKKVQKIFSKEK